MTIEVTGDREVIRHFQSIPGNVQLSLERAVGRLALKLQRRVMMSKLTGQVLKVRTGTLRRSIDQAVVREAGGVVGIVSTKVKYGRQHEFGGQVTIPEHLRLVKQAFGKELKFPVYATVKQHTARFPERSFLRSALAEMRPEIVEDLAAAVGEGIKA